MELEKLKKLRTRRMEQCFIELQTRRQVLSEWEINLQQKEQQLADFQRWRLEHQEALFASLQTQSFNPQGWLDYRTKLEDLRLQEEKFREELSQVQDAMQAASLEVEAARKQSAEANIKLEKLKEIIQIHAGKTPAEEPAQ